MIELNPFLQPIGTPITTNNQISGYQFDSYNERNAVTASHIKNFSFNSGQGGTLILGGTGNVSGVLSIKDAGGTERVRGDEEGLKVYDGSISLENDSGTDFVDLKGLISTASFTSTDSANAALNQNIATNNTETDITGATLSFTLARESVVLIQATSNGWITYGASDSGSSSILLKVNSGGAGNTIIYSGAGSHGETIEQSGSIFFVDNLSAGSYTIKLVGILYISANNPVFTVNAFGLSYIILGK